MLPIDPEFTALMISYAKSIGGCVLMSGGMIGALTIYYNKTHNYVKNAERHYRNVNISRNIIKVKKQARSSEYSNNTGGGSIWK